MQIHIFMNIVKEIELKQEFISLGDHALYHRVEYTIAFLHL